MDLRPEDVTSEVQRVLGRDGVVVTGVRGLWQPRLASTRAVYRVDLDDDRAGPHALVVKYVDGSSQGSSLPREAELYASAALPAGGSGLSCPRFYGLSEGPGGGVGIWLELVESRAAGERTAETFARVAEHLGQFTRSCTPETVTAARRVPTRDLCSRPDLMQRSLELLDQHTNDRLVRQVYPADISRGLHQLWERREPITAAAAAAPRGVCHGDAQPNNLLPRSSRTTIAIDWANLATAPIGLDAATLFHYAIAYFDFDVDQADSLDNAIFNGYIRGLGAIGQAQTAAIRLTYCTQLALGLGLLEVGPVLRMIIDHDRREAAERFYQRPLHEVLNRRHSLATLLLDLGREARSNSEPASIGSAHAVPRSAD